jgi:hypothetical protein
MIVSATRSDGMGERLCAILNGLLVAELTGASFQFTWGSFSDPGRHHAIVGVHGMFAPSFVKRHYVAADVPRPGRTLTLPTGSILEVTRSLTAAIKDGATIVPQGPLLIERLVESRQTKVQLADTIWSQITFSDPLERIRQEVLGDGRFPHEAVGIHVRSGDILYGAHAHDPRWISKVIPAPMAAVIARAMIATGRPVVLCGQETETLPRMAAALGATWAPDHYPRPPTSSVERAFMDALVLGRCTTAFAGSSGFSRFARHVQLQEPGRPSMVHRVQDWPQLLRDEVVARGAMYTPQQRAYTYLACLDSSLRSDTVERMPDDIAQARLHQPDQGMYTLIEALIPLFGGDLATSHRRLATLFGNRRPALFGGTLEKHLRLLATGGTEEGAPLSYARFVPPRFPGADAAGFPLVAAVTGFLQRPYSEESLARLRSDLKDARP